MSSWQIRWRIVLPSALRRTLPPYCNEAVMMLHSTSLASVVPSLTDVTAVASRIYSDYYLTAAVIYLCVTFALIGCFRLLEKRYMAYLAPRTY